MRTHPEIRSTVSAQLSHDGKPRANRFTVQKPVRWRYSTQLLQISLNYAYPAL